MFLQKLKANNFKNLEEVSVNFSPFINCFLGENGSGKTNLLDAIYFLCFTKSLYNISENQTIRTGSTFFRITCELSLLENKYLNLLECAFSAETKKIFKLNGQEYERLSAHIGKFPLVILTPDDTDLIREGSETRRKFFDGLICQMDNAYLNNLISYNYLLKQRNALLKTAADTNRINYDLFEPYNHKLLYLNYNIAATRRKFIDEFIPLFLRQYAFISSDQEVPKIAYSSQVEKSGFESIFKSNFERDIILQRTSKGIHADDFDFELNNNPVKKTASQGQKKSFVMALKLAQFKLIEKEKGIKPFLLLDDIFDKLDDKRIEKLIELIASNTFGQIFLTDARPERSKGFFAGYSGVSNFIVSRGEIKEEK